MRTWSTRFRELSKVNRGLAVATFEKNKDFYHPICRAMVEKDLFGEWAALLEQGSFLAAGVKSSLVEIRISFSSLRKKKSREKASHKIWAWRQKLDLRTFFWSFHLSLDPRWGKKERNQISQYLYVHTYEINSRAAIHPSIHPFSLASHFKPRSR